MSVKNKFSFWFPAEIEKAEIDEVSGIPKKMLLKGIASTNKKDLDNQLLSNNGFVLDYLLERGFVNWHHRAKDDPSFIIGEPTNACKVTKDGLYVEAELYNTDNGRKAFKTACDIEKYSSSKRRLGWSVEGKPIEVRGNKIVKAMITGLALTYAPKNSPTYAEIAKAFTDEEAAKKILKAVDVEEDEEDVSSIMRINAENGTLFVNSKGNIVTFVEKALSAGEGRGFESGGNPLKNESQERGIKIQNDYSLKRKKRKLVKVMKAVDANLMMRICEKYPDMDITKALKIHDKVLYS